VTQNVDGLARTVKGSKLRAIQSGNALRLFPNYAGKKASKVGI
jgi:hypothetical protein